MDILKRKTQQVDMSVSKVFQSLEKFSMIYANKISLLTKSLDVYDVQRALKRGFVLVKQNSKFVTRASGFSKGKKALLKFYDGEVTTQ
jgi:exonuclease VII large subunit